MHHITYNYISDRSDSNMTIILLENVEHCGGEPEQAVLWLQAHEQTKLHAEMMS